MLTVAACGRIGFDGVGAPGDATSARDGSVDGLPAAIGAAQQAPLSSIGSVTTTTITFPDPPSAGNLVVVYAWSWAHDGGTDLQAGNVTDSAGDTYAVAVTIHTTSCTNGVSGEGAGAIFYATAPATAMPLTLTLAPSGAAVTFEIGVTAIEYTGVHTLDVVASATTPSMASPYMFDTGVTPMTAAPDELLAAVGNNCNGNPNVVTWNDVAGFTVRAMEAGTNVTQPGIATDKLVTARGQYSDAWLFGYSANGGFPAIGAIATFR